MILKTGGHLENLPLVHSLHTGTQALFAHARLWLRYVLYSVLNLPPGLKPNRNKLTSRSLSPASDIVLETRQDAHKTRVRVSTQIWNNARTCDTVGTSAPESRPQWNYYRPTTHDNEMACLYPSFKWRENKMQLKKLLKYKMERTLAKRHA
jgi:hypothetical protein